MTSTANGKKTGDWKLLAVAAVVSIMFAFLGVSWQAAIDAAEQNNKDIVKLEDTHDTDIARLDESNRNRRNQIADLEERIARVEERTGG